MTSARHLFFYFFTISASILLLLFIIKIGPDSHGIASAAAASLDWSQILGQEFAKNIQAPVTGLLTQIFIILVFTRICAMILKKWGQPQVIGEMIAGILLGKSVFALIAPDFFNVVFPDSAMPRLYILAQVGLIFFMFVVGLDLKISELKNRAMAAISISHASIVVPFLLGSLVSLGLYKNYGPPNIPFSSFALFMGIAMSITAFPVLARILQEKKMTDTPLGTTALTCAAVDDVTAWWILAAVVGIAKAGTMLTAVSVFVTTFVYVIFMIKGVRPLLKKALRPETLDGKFTHAQLAIVFCVLVGSALIAEIIGIHALFGAFLAGTIMPQNPNFRSSLIGKIEDFSAVVLLPIFFTYTGIRMQIGLLDSVESWLICGGLIIIAIIGKMFGSAIAAKGAGMSWRDSWAIGTLMNTRGLMELIVLNIGYDLGILTPAIFTMMVIMAIVTTLMTSPLLSFILPKTSPRF